MKPITVANILDQPPPSDLEAERAVLSSIMLANSSATIDDVSVILRPSDFHDDANQRIYEAMLAIQEVGNPTDLLLVQNHLKDSGEYEQIGGASYLARVLSAAANSSHAIYHARIVREKSVRRRLIDLAIIAGRDAHTSDNVGSVIAKLALELDGLDNRTTSRELVDSRGIVDIAVSNYERRQRGESDVIPTGLHSLDSFLGGGFARTDYVVIGARTSFGKTALALSLLAGIADDGTRQALLFSIEMNRDEIADRLTASVGRIPTLPLRLGKLNDDDRHRFVETTEKIRRLSFRVDDSPQQTVASIARVARRESRRLPLSCIVVDYLQLLEATKRADRRDMELAQMSRKFKALAQELRCPVITLAQLNKEADGARPKMSHLREADSISHEANVVLLLDRPEFDKERKPDEGEPCKLIVDKNRNGPRGVSVSLLWFARYTQFAEPAPTRHAAIDEFNQRGIVT